MKIPYFFGLLFLRVSAEIAANSTNEAHGPKGPNGMFYWYPGGLSCTNDPIDYYYFNYDTCHKVPKGAKALDIYRNKLRHHPKVFLKLYKDGTTCNKAGFYYEAVKVVKGHDTCKSIRAGAIHDQGKPFTANYVKLTPNL